MRGAEQVAAGTPKRLRVHALVDTLGSGGAEFLLSDFAEVAAGAGIDFSVASLKPITSAAPAAERLRRGGLEPEAVPVTSLANPRELLRVRAHLAKVRPDVLHTHLGTADYFGGIAGWSLRIPLVTTIHADWWPENRADRVRTWLAARSRRHFADVVVAVSESARSAYLTAGRDVPGHVVVVRNGIVDRARPGAGAGVRRELGLRSDELVVTAVSSMRPEKNFEGSIDAVGLLRDRFPQARLVIAGDGPHEDAVRRHAVGLGDAVILPGHREDVMELLDASDVLVHPSHFDAFPTTALEAMAASVPIVGTGVGGLLEIVEPGVSGVLVPPPPTAEAIADGLAPLLADAELRTRIGSAGRARYEREFDASAWVARMRALYERVLAARGRSPMARTGSVSARDR